MTNRVSVPNGVILQHLETQRQNSVQMWKSLDQVDRNEQQRR